MGENRRGAWFVNEHPGAVNEAAGGEIEDVLKVSMEWTGKGMV
jgi:hypothetical protein